MCVICVKPEGKDLPSPDRIKAMFESNSDGAGMMFVRGEKVHIRKGYMKLKHFMKALEVEHITKADLAVFHFRIATAGSTSPKNCHPFPVSENVSELRATNFSTDLAMAHNGILDFAEDKKADLSDTMTFVRDILADVSIRKHIMSPAIFTLLEMSIGHSKMIFLDKTKQFTLLGNWVEDKTAKDGLYYSNLNFTYRCRPAGTLYYNSGYGYFTTDQSKGGHLQLVPPLDKNDLDRDAYENNREDSGGVTAKELTREFARNQQDSAVAIFPEDKNCPYCDTPINSDRQVFCSKCGKAFDRSFSD